VAKLGDFRIEDRLRIIDAIDGRILRTELRIRDAVRDSPDTTILESIPEFGRYTALTIAAEIDGIGRFADSHKLCVYAGIVPSVLNSADTVHHGRMTKRGSPMMRWLASAGENANDGPVTASWRRRDKPRRRVWERNEMSTVGVFNTR